MHIIIYGDPGDGFHYVGPFDNEDDAITYAEHDGERNRDWWLSDIAAPAGEEAKDDGIARLGGVTVTVTTSGQDGTPVVFVDTDEALDGSEGPRIRIRLNDEPVYVGRVVT